MLFFNIFVSLHFCSVFSVLMPPSLLSVARDSFGCDIWFEVCSVIGDDCVALGCVSVSLVMLLTISFVFFSFICFTLDVLPSRSVVIGVG